MTEPIAEPMSDWRDFSTPVLPPILLAALRCFTRSGYHGTTTRNLASEAGLSVPGLYHHFASKQAILQAITTASMQNLMQRSLAALHEAGEDPLRQLETHIECMALFHAHYRDLAFIATSEIRALEGENSTNYLAARDAQERLLRGIIERGVAEGVFSVPDVKGAARALATLCTGVSQWFNPDGERSATDVAAEYVELARRLVHAKG